MTFGERLKDLRSKKGYTQKQVAEILKVGRATIAGYETKSIYPDYEKLIVLANLFNCSTDYLLGRNELPNYFSSDLINLTDRIVELLISENIISNTETITAEKTGVICEKLKIALDTIDLLKRISKYK